MIAVASLIGMQFLSRARDVSAAASAGAAMAVDARQNDCPRAWDPSWRQFSTGLGKIYQFTVEDLTGHNRYSLMDRRTLLDWFIKSHFGQVPA